MGEARTTLLQCIRLAYLRDCRSWPKFHLAKVDATGSSVEGPLLIDSDWTYAKGVAGYGQRAMESEEEEIQNVFEYPLFGKCVVFPIWGNIELSIWTIMRSPSFCESIVQLKNLDLRVTFLKMA